MKSEDFLDWVMTAALAVIVILGIVVLIVEVIKAIV